MTWTILAVLTGKVSAFRNPDEPSAIAKSAVAGPVLAGPMGLAGDEQADLRVHGGPDKAIYHYPADNYPFWREELGDHPLLENFGAFGENIVTEGLTEAEACIGDVYRLGSALVQISHGRQPCWKLDHRFAGKRVLAGFVQSRRCGWYYRVMEAGAVSAGDALTLVDRPLPQWSVERAFGLLIAGDHKTDPAAVRELAGMDVLAQAWRSRAVELAG